MAHRYVPVDREQSFFLASSFREVLGEDHLVWTVIDVVDQLDISALEARYGDHERGGRPAFDPRMMLTLLFYAYCTGLRSSRGIEAACRSDWAYRAICANLAPDHATIARFRVSLDDLLARLFAQVLAVCAELGLGQLGTVALDGTKVAAAASKAASRTAERLAALERQAEQLLAEAEAADAGDDGSGVSPTRRVAERARRLERIRQAAAQVATQAQPPTGADPTSPPPRPARGGPARANTTDPDSRMMKTPTGFIQGYNAQAVASADQLVLAAAVTTATGDVNQLGPMLEATRANLAAAGIDSPIGVALADAGYWSEANAALEMDTELLIATTKATKQPRCLSEPEPEPGPPSLEERAATRLPVVQAVLGGTLTRAEAAKRLGLSPIRITELVNRYRRQGPAGLALRHQPNGAGRPKPRITSAAVARKAMEAKLAIPENRALYAQRSWLIEGVFAHAKEGRNFRRFLRRGLLACDAEWKLLHLAGNVLKAHRWRAVCSHRLVWPRTAARWRPITATLTFPPPRRCCSTTRRRRRHWTR